MTSTGAQDRDSRRARHAQRVSRVREQRGREPRESAYASVDPFELVRTGQPAEQPLPF